jgi:hypothetical protein
VTPAGERITTSWKRFNLLQRFDGYSYDCRRTASSVWAKRPPPTIGRESTMIIAMAIRLGSYHPWYSDETKKRLAARTWKHMQDHADAKTEVAEAIMERAMNARLHR